MQQRLKKLGYLQEGQVTSVFDDVTEAAVLAFCKAYGLEENASVTEKTWSVLVDASFDFGDRTLYLRMPYFHGNDVFELQRALYVLGFTDGAMDGIFGAHTESAVRKFQQNFGLPSDGIVGAFTFKAIRNLRHIWEGKDASPIISTFGLARVADVLEKHALCIYGVGSFTRDVASRMSNLAFATSVVSKTVSADTLLAVPHEDMLMVQIVLPEDETPEEVPRVSLEDEDSLVMRLRTAISATKHQPPRVALEIPGKVWMNAGAVRSAQHFAIMLLDALCTSLS
ncbi:MAG: peptidoglycan-binding protein [Eggerthellaceae bacterium]|nr:peptidoglycan-binding protein [Eggerthellaceae bacterium]